MGAAGQPLTQAEMLAGLRRLGVARLFNAQTLVDIYERLLRIQPYAVYGLPEPQGQ